jgi:hypothetical protein
MLSEACSLVPLSKPSARNELYICRYTIPELVLFLNVIPTLMNMWEPGSSGSIVSDYGLDNRAIGGRSPAEAKDFSFSLCVQTGSGAHPASCTMGTEGPFFGGKARPGCDADHSPPSNAEVVNK